MESTRKEVYSAIDTERDYQDAQRPERFSETCLPIAGELVCIRTYLNMALDGYTFNVGETPEEVLHIIRKIAGMCVRAMEHHGALVRTEKTKLSEITDGGIE